MSKSLIENLETCSNFSNNEEIFMLKIEKQILLDQNSLNHKKQTNAKNSPICCFICLKNKKKLEFCNFCTNYNCNSCIININKETTICSNCKIDRIKLKQNMKFINKIKDSKIMKTNLAQKMKNSENDLYFLNLEIKKLNSKIIIFKNEQNIINTKLTISIINIQNKINDISKLIEEINNSKQNLYNNEENLNYYNTKLQKKNINLENIKKEINDTILYNLNIKNEILEKTKNLKNFKNNISNKKINKKGYLCK